MACFYDLFVNVLLPFSEGHVTTQLMQIFPDVNIFSGFSTPMINLASLTIQMQFGNESSATAGRRPPYRSYDVIIYDIIAGHGNVYENSSSQNRGKAVAEASLCFQGESNDKQYDLTGSFKRLPKKWHYHIMSKLKR